jgi:hypothetical protein
MPNSNCSAVYHIKQLQMFITVSTKLFFFPFPRGTLGFSRKWIRILQMLVTVSTKLFFFPFPRGTLIRRLQMLVTVSTKLFFSLPLRNRWVFEKTDPQTNKTRVLKNKMSWNMITLIQHQRKCNRRQ